MGDPGDSSADPDGAVPRLRGGAWIVSSRTGEDGREDINFTLKDPDVPHEQITLKGDVERTLSALHVLYSESPDKFKEAFEKLLSLARVGLVGPKASPSVSIEALASLHREIVDREAGNIKNSYLRHLGLWCLIGWALAFFPFFASHWLRYGPVAEDAAFFLLVSGAPVGAWVSFATRKVRLEFFDLIQMEEDRVDPSLRVVFVGLLSLLFGLMLKSGAVDLQLGDFRASGFSENNYSAFLLGVLLGVSEKVLPARVLDHANSLMGRNG